MKRCGEVMLDNGRIAKCNRRWGSEHSHQDFSLATQVKRGDAHWVKATPRLVLNEIKRIVDDYSWREFEGGNFMIYINKALRSGK